jgi:hypothetical protein
VVRAAGGWRSPLNCLIVVRSVWAADPNWDERLWRYFKTQRFVSTMEDSSFYFAAATQFRDPFEGAVAVMPPDFPVDPRYAEIDQFEHAFRELKRLTKLNCWHRAEYESDAMWRLYAEESKGVAICSTPDRMRAAFRPFRLQPQFGVEDLWGGVVLYEDLLSVRLNPKMEDRFFYKHLAFSWEREFRLAISLRIAEENGVNVPESGIQVAVDLERLIDRIMLGPSLSGEEREVIMDKAHRAGLAARVSKSSLYGRPRYI